MNIHTIVSSREGNLKEFVSRTLSITTLIKILKLHKELISKDLNKYDFLSVKNYEGWTLYFSIEDGKFCVDKNELSLEELCIYITSNELTYDFVSTESGE